MLRRRTNHGFTFLTAGCLAVASLALQFASAAGAPDIVWNAGGHVGINDLAISPDHTILATCSLSDSTIKLWDLANGRLLRTLAQHVAGLQAVAFSPDGQYVASGGDVAFGSGDVNLKLWRVADATVVRTFGDVTDNPQPNWSVAFSPDGTLLAAGHGSDVAIWRVSDSTLMRTLTGHSGSVFAVKFSPDGSLLASGSADATAKLWRVSDGALQRTLIGHSFFVGDVDFSPDGQNIATGSWDRSIKIWRVSNGQLLRTIPNADTDAVYTLDYSLDGSLIASGGGDTNVRLWNPATGQLVRSLSHPGLASTQAVAFSSDGQSIFTGGSESRARRWRVSDATLQSTLGTHTARLRDVAFSPEGKFVTGSDDRVAYLWDARTGNKLSSLVGHNDVINGVALSPDNQLVATAAGSPIAALDHSIKLWNAQTGALIRTLPGHLDNSRCVAFSPDSKFLASGGSDQTDGRVRLWRISDGVEVRQFHQPAAVDKLTWSADGAVILAASSTSVRYWNASSGALERTVTTAAGIDDLVLSPDGASFALAEASYGNNVSLWRYSDGSLLRVFAGHSDGFAQGVAISPDNKTLVSGSGFARELKLWQIDNGALLATYDRETGWGPDPTFPVRLSFDGGLIGYGRNDATVDAARQPFASIRLNLRKNAGSLHLEWEGGFGPYTLRRALDPRFTQGVTPLLTDSPALSYDDPVLADGQTYFYLVEQ